MASQEAPQAASPAPQVSQAPEGPDSSQLALEGLVSKQLPDAVMTRDDYDASRKKALAAAKSKLRAAGKERANGAVSATPDGDDDDKGALESTYIPGSPKPEAAPKTEEAPKQDKISKAWAALAQRERSVGRSAAQAKEVEARATAQAAEAQRILDAVTQDPIGFVTERVGPEWYQRATDRFVQNGGQPTEAERLKNLESSQQNIAKMVEDGVRKQVEAMQQQYAQQNQWNQVLSNIDEGLKAPEFELTRRFPGARDEVAKLIVGYYEREKRLLTPRDAIGMIEAELVKAFPEAKRKSQNGAADEPEKKPKASAERPRTIGQNLSADMPVGGRGPRSPAERRKAAADVLRKARQRAS